MSDGAPRRSIDRKLTWTVVIVTGASLLSACVAFGLYDAITLRRTLTREASTLAQVIGVNSAVALAFNDPSAAQETLASLAAAGAVQAAWILDRNGNLFAVYTAESDDLPPTRVRLGGASSCRLEGDHLDCRNEISLGDERVGSIQLRIDASTLRMRNLHYATILAVLLLAASTVALLVAARLRRGIGRPLAELADGSEAIAGGDLSIRIEAKTNDEIGVLARTFDAMTASLREVVDHVRGSIAEVTEISRGLRESGRSMAGEAGRQRTAVADTAQSVEQVGASIVEVGHSVDELANFSQETSSSMLELDASIADIAEHMDQLTSSIETTSSAAHQVGANVEEVAAGVETLRSATHEASARLEQLGRSVGHVKENADETRELAEDSSHEASEGVTAVIETIQSMRQIAASFEDLQGTVSKLATRSHSIDQIIGVIEEVAAQTTLLSLNAAIIAAQAGEHGKSFSVVADEVKNLADRTQRSTREITALTQGVQDDTAAAVAAVEVGSAKVASGVERSNVAGAVLRKLLEKSRNAAERVASISEAAGSQGLDLERLEAAMGAVREIVERIHQSAREQQHATNSIVEAVQRIRGLGGDVRRSTDEQRRRSGLVAEASSHVAEKIQQIAAAAQAQAASSQTIQQALAVFRDGAEETARRSEDINQMVRTLLQRSGQLQQEIDRFKTG